VSVHIVLYSEFYLLISFVGLRKSWDSESHKGLPWDTSRWDHYRGMARRKMVQKYASWPSVADVWCRVWPTFLYQWAMPSKIGSTGYSYTMGYTERSDSRRCIHGLHSGWCM
jgi:hypothetical protein